MRLGSIIRQAFSALVVVLDPNLVAPAAAAPASTLATAAAAPTGDKPPEGEDDEEQLQAPASCYPLPESDENLEIKG